MKHKKLKDVVSLRAGYSFRGRIESHADGDFQVIQLKDVDMENGISHTDLILTRLPGRPPSMLLKNGDLAFVARGKNNYAVCAQNIQSSTVLSQHFIHIRPVNTKELLPEYLCWYLNYNYTAKKHLRKGAQGTAMPTVTRSMLEEMEVHVPSISIQKKVIEIQDAHIRERIVLKQLLDNNFISISSITNQILTGGITP